MNDGERDDYAGERQPREERSAPARPPIDGNLAGQLHPSSAPRPSRRLIAMALAMPRGLTPKWW